MEQEFAKNTYVLQEDEKIGSVKIADDVVAMIAALAATEVEGVAAMSGNMTHEFLSKVGVKNAAKGTRVEVLQQKVKVDLAITIEYGFNIPATCQRVQSKVKNAVENMTGLEVTDVNIRIAGINVAKDREDKAEVYMSRRELREQIFKLLFRIEFNSPEEMPEQEQLFFEDSCEADGADEEYISSKYRKIAEKLETIDEM